MHKAYLRSIIMDSQGVGMSDGDGITGRRKKMRLVFVCLLMVLCLAGAGTSVFFYQKYQQTQHSVEAQQKKILSRIGTVIALPSGSSTAVTVIDKSKLSNKTLASRVENQDLLFIFGQAKRIVIYRPSSGLVTDMLTFTSQPDLPKSSVRNP